jgi:cytochrome c553
MKGCMVRYSLVFVISIAALLTLSPNSGIADNDQMKIPPARKIPGLTTEDKFPNGCVDCHINMPHIKQDERISTLMSKWNKNVETKLLKKAQAVAQAGVTLKGIHPPAPESLKDIPAACITCHSKNTGTTAPPLAALLHVIHLTGGDDNHFLTIFQGECTYCHKMNVTTGVWMVPNGPEK